MREEDIDKLLKNKINSEIKAPEELKNRIKNEIKNIKEDKKTKTKSKLRVIQSIAAVAVFSILGMTTYATVTKNPILEKMGLIKGSTKYDEISENINQDISNEYANILLNKMAADDAYIIMEYNVKLTQEGIEKFGKIEQDINSGYKINITNTVKINNENIEQTEGIKEYSNKISDTEYKIYQIIDITNIKNKELNIEISEKYLQANDKQTEINKVVLISATKNDNIKSFETIENKINNKTIKIEDFQNTGFETFVKISVDIDNLKKQDMDFYSENYPNHLSFTVLDNNNNYISNNCYNKVAYIQDNLGNKQDILTTYDEKNNISFDNAKAHLEYLITLGNIDTNIKNIKIVPYTFVLQNERTEETEQYYNNLKWYKLEDGNYSQTSTLGGKIDITKIETTEGKIRFYYKTSGKITGYEQIVLLRINDKKLGFNIIEGTNGYAENINAEENYIEFDRNIENTGIYSNNFKNDDDYKLSDLSKLEFTLLVEPKTKVLNDGTKIEVPNKNENYLKINKVEVKNINTKTNLQSVNNTNTGLETENSTENNTISEEQNEKLDIESKLIQNLNKKIVKYNNLGTLVYKENQQTDYFDSSFYKDTKVEYKDLSNEEKIVAVINSITPRKDVNINEIKNPNKLWDKESFLESTDKKIYTKEQLEETTKSVFGENASDIKWETLDMCGSVLDYVDGNYYEYSYNGGGLGYTNIAASKIIRAEKQGDYIYIYDKFIYCDETEYWAGNGKQKFYKSSSKKNKINNVQTVDDDSYYDRMDKILDKNLNICPIYKHTFKCDDKGNWYWISSEPIE